MVSSTALFDLSLAELGQAVARPTPTPGSGSVAAALGALGAGLVSMAFRHTPREGGAIAFMEGRADEVDALRLRLQELVEEDARAYLGLAAAREREGGEGATLDSAVRASIDVPVQIAESATAALRLAAVGVGDSAPELACEARLGAEALHTAVSGALDVARANLSAADEGLRGEIVDLSMLLERQAQELLGAVRESLAGGAA